MVNRVGLYIPSLLRLPAGHKGPTNVLRVFEDTGLDGLMFTWLRHELSFYYAPVYFHSQPSV